MRLHLEPIYGFYHGQDPRTFSPDHESCTEKEIQAHKDMCKAADEGAWMPDDSGCNHVGSTIICKSSLGIGVYHVVMDEDGGYVRDATYEDWKKEGDWDEPYALAD